MHGASIRRTSRSYANHLWLYWRQREKTPPIRKWLVEQRVTRKQWKLPMIQGRSPTKHYYTYFGNKLTLQIRGDSLLTEEGNTALLSFYSTEEEKALAQKNKG